MRAGVLDHRGTVDVANVTVRKLASPCAAYQVWHTYNGNKIEKNKIKCWKGIEEGSFGSFGVGRMTDQDDSWCVVYHSLLGMSGG